MKDAEPGVLFAIQVLVVIAANEKIKSHERYDHTQCGQAGYDGIKHLGKTVEHELIDKMPDGSKITHALADKKMMCFLILIAFFIGVKVVQQMLLVTCQCNAVVDICCTQFAVVSDDVA